MDKHLEIDMIYQSDKPLQGCKSDQEGSNNKCVKNDNISINTSKWNSRWTEQTPSHLWGNSYSLPLSGVRTDEVAATDYVSFAVKLFSSEYVT